MNITELIEMLQDEAKTNPVATVRILIPGFTHLAETMDPDDRTIAPVECASNYHTVTIHCE